MAKGERLARHGWMSSELGSCSDRQLASMVDRAAPRGTGIGGTSAVLEVDRTPVFVKRIRLTDIERKTSNVESTANLFGLPVKCQYGVGSPGFGAWRELAACITTTDWVLSGLSDAFPLLYHWRVLPGVGPRAGDAASMEREVAFWGGSSALRGRLAALADATASLVLFLEFVPYTLQAWLSAQVTEGRVASEAAAVLMEAQLLPTVELMNAAGIHHFDGHFGNLLTDGRQLFFADFGLATSPSFEFSEAEARFLHENRTHDSGYAAMRLVNWLVAAFAGVGPVCTVEERNGLVRALADGAGVAGAPEAVSRLVDRLAPAAAVMNGFYYELFTGSRAARYPAGRVAEALAARP